MNTARQQENAQMTHIQEQNWRKCVSFVSYIHARHIKHTVLLMYLCILYYEECHWGTTDDFATSFLHFPLFSTALWDLAKSRPVHSLILSSHLFLCLPCLLPPFTVSCKMVLARLMYGKHDHTTAVCVSFRSSEGLRVVQLSAGSWHGLPRW